MALVSRRDVSSQMVPLDRKFVLNGQGLQECFVTASGGERILILFRESQPQGFEVSVEENRKWEPVRPENLPEELTGTELSIPLKTVIKIASFTVAKLQNGNFTIRLGEVSKKEQQMIERLQQRQTLQRQLQVVDRDLIKVKRDHFLLNNSYESEIKKWNGIAGAGVTAATGVVLATVLVPAAFLTGPVGLALGTLIGLVALGVGWACVKITKKGFSDKQNQAAAFEGLINEAKSCFEQNQEACLVNNESLIIDRVKHFMESLKKEKFVKTFSPFAFEFDESGFNDMKSLYAAEDRDKVSAMMRLLILMSVAALPLSVRPTDSIINLMQHVGWSNIDPILHDYCILIRGRLHIDRGNYTAAKADFQSIAEASDMYTSAQNYLMAMTSMNQQNALEL